MSDWIEATEVFARAGSPGGFAQLSPLAKSICQRAHAGLIDARAKLYIVGSDRREDVSIPQEFWWAEGHAALSQDWRSGDFSTYLDGNKGRRAQAFGVSFEASGVLPLLAGFAPITSATATPKAAANKGGKSRSDAWPDAIAELVALIHEEGIPIGQGTKGSDAIIKKVQSALETEGKQVLERTAMQPVVNATLLRLRRNEA